MKKVVAISGWGQAYNALAKVTPKETTHLDYSQFNTIDIFFDSIKNLQCDILIGWSLGGQLALRAISEGIFKPKNLILISTPYQFVASKEIKCAMNIDTFEIFVNNFKHDHEKTLKRFLTLITRNDINSHDILAKLRHDISMENIQIWEYWLEELEVFSCNEIDFSLVPNTIAIHGRDDTLVDITQTGLFKSLISNYKLEIFPNCGHAPHLHDEMRVRGIINSLL